MKKFLYIIFSIILFSCVKDDIDYRDNLVGVYEFKIEVGSYPSLYFNDTIINYQGLIDKSKVSKDKIIVDWGKDTICNNNGIYFTQIVELTFDTNGNLRLPDYNSSGNTYFSDSSFIRSDSICFFISCGGLGSWKNWNVIGIKQKLSTK